MKITIDEFEKKINKKINKNVCSLGLDIAERTGLCYIITDNKFVTFNWWCIEFDKKEINLVYKEMYDELKRSILNMNSKNNVVIIEDSFLMRFGKFIQADVFKKLTRFGTLALSICLENKVPYHFILAKSARAKLKIKMETGKPKESVANYLKEVFDIKLDDTDASDAIVLAILGIINNQDFRSDSEIKKSKKEKK